MGDNLENNKNLYIEYGNTGLERFGGTIYEEFLPELKGPRGIKIYKEMSSNDATIGAILFATQMLIRQVAWRVETNGNTKEDEENADFLRGCMDDMSMTWSDTISEILSMLTFGWSYHEIVYKRRLGPNKDSSRNSRFNDGKIGWRKIPIRSQDSLYEWVFDQNGGLQGMVQMAPPSYKLVTIPIEKSLHFRTLSQKNNPEGRSVLRNAYRSWYFKKNIEVIEGIGIERDLAGLPIVYVPPELLSPTATTEEKAVLTELKKIVTSVKRNEQEGVIMPLLYDDKGNKMYDFALLSSGGRRQFDINATIQRYDQRIAMTILADFILLGHENVGSYSLSSNKTNLFAVALGAWLDSIAEVFNRYAVPRLFELNAIKTDQLPQIVHGDVESVDLKELGEYISKLSGAGMELFPNNELENHLLKVANLPKNQDGGV